MTTRDEWLQQRSGMITASQFHRVLTKGRKAGELSGTAHDYMLELLAELITGSPAPEFRSRHTDWGNEHEPDARSLYAWQAGNIVTEAGFVSTEDFIGATPDGYVDPDGLIEIKCPSTTKEHMRAVLSGEMPAKHAAQVYGQMWVTGREWVDFVSYDPRCGAAHQYFCVRVPREDNEIKKVADAVLGFRDRLLQNLEKLNAQK